MAIDTITSTAPNETAIAVRGLVDVALTGFTAPTIQSEQAVLQIASLSGLTPAAVVELLRPDQGNDALQSQEQRIDTLVKNADLLKNADIELQIAGISTGILEQGLNVQALSQNTDFLQVAHYVYDTAHGDGAWAARVRGEIEDALWRELSDEEYTSRNDLHAIAAEHGVQSEEFLKASIEAHAEFPQHSHRGPNARIREVEYSLNQANSRVRDAEREIEFIQNDDSLTAEEKTQHLEFAERSLELATETRDRWATHWGREFVQPLRNNESELKLAETLFERLSNSDEFLIQAQAEYDRLALADTPPRPTWEEHIAQLNAEYEASWNPFASKPDADALLTEWGKGRIDQKMGLGQFDFSKMEEFGLDTGIFEASDLQNQREDTAQADIGGRFGRAWLHASEIVYNGKNDTPWAEHLNTELSATLDGAASPEERSAAEVLIKIASEHGAASAEFMEATEKFLTDYPESATSKRVLELNADLAKEGEWALRWQDGNLGSALRTEGIEFLGIEGRSEEFQAAARYLVRLDEYTRYEWGNDFWQDMGVGVLDPTQIISLVATGVVTVYSGGTGSAPTIAGTQAARAGLLSLFSGVTRQGIVQGAKTGVVLNATEGFIGEAGIELANQNTEIGLGVRSERDNVSILMRGGTGAAMGTVLGAGFGAASHVGAKFTSNFFKQTNVGQGISIRATEIKGVAADFMTFKPRATEVEAEAPPQLGPTIEAAAKLEEATPSITADPAPAVAAVAPEQVDAPVIETTLAPEITAEAPVIKAETPAAPVVDDTIVTLPPVNPPKPANANITGGAFTPWMTDSTIPGMPRIAAAPFDERVYGRPVFSPADSNRGPTPSASPSTGKRHAVNGRFVNGLIETLSDAEKAFLRDKTPEARAAYDAALEAINTAKRNTDEFSPSARERLSRSADDSQDSMKDVLSAETVVTPPAPPVVDDAVSADAVRLLIAQAKADAFDAGQGNMDVNDAAKALRENLANIRNGLSDELPAAERANLVTEISRESANANNIVLGIDTTTPRPTARVEETTTPRPHVEGEEPTAPKPRGEGDTVDAADAPPAGRAPYNDEKSWVHGQDPNFREDGYKNPANNSDPDLTVGAIDPDLPFRRVRKAVDPTLDRVNDPVLGDIKTRKVENEFGEKVDEIVSGVYRTLEHFQTGFEDGTKRFMDAIQAADGDAAKIQQALDDYSLTLDKMDAATDVITDFGRAGTTLRNSTRRDYAGALSSKKNAPNITKIQKVAIQEQIVDARLLAQKMQEMASEPDGQVKIMDFLQDVAQRVNTSGAQLDQYDTLIASGWEAHVGKRNGVPLVLGENGKPVKGRNGKPQFLIGHTVLREKNRLGYDIAEGANAYTHGSHLPREAIDPNIENKGTAILQHIVKEFQESTQPNETRIDTAAKKIIDGIKNNQLHDLLYYLQRDAWMAQKSHTNIFEGQFSEILRVVKEGLEANGELTTYEMGALKRLEVEVTKILNDNPAGQLTENELRFFNLAHDGKTIGGRELRQRVANADMNTDLTGGRYYNAIDGNRSDAARGVIGASFNRGVYDWIFDYGLRLKDVDAEATFKDRSEKITNWRYHFDENSSKWHGNWRFGNPLSFSGMRTNLSTAGRVYERWMTPVGFITGSLKYAPDNTPLLNTKFGKYLRTKTGMRPVRFLSHAAWAGGAYATGGALFMSPLSPLGLAYQGTGLLATGQSALLGNNVNWGYTSDLLGATPEAATTPPAPVTTTGEEVPVVDVSNTNEAIKIRQWAGQHRDDDALKLPNHRFSGDDEAYIESIVLKAAELLKANPSAYPNVRWSTVSNDNDFTQVWNAARDEVNAGLRNNLVKEAATKAYAALTGREATYNFAGDEALNFDKVVGWLQANTDNIAPIDADTLMPTDPWATNSAAFTAAVKAHEDSLTPEAIKARKDAALAGFAADRGVPLLALNAAEKEAAILLSNAFKTPEIGLFYTAEELGGDNDASKALRSGTLADVNAVIEQRAQEAAIEAAKQARIQAALIGYANDKGSGLEGLTQAEKDAAAMIAETKDASGEFHSDAYLSGIAGRAKRQSLLTATVEAAAETERRRNNPNIPNNIDLSVSLDQTKQAGANVVNWLTDTDNDGYSALIDTDWGRALSGSLQQAGGAIGNLWGNLNQTEGGRQTIGIGAGIITALALPSIVRNIPILKNIANIPFVGGLLFAAIGFFAATKGVDALYKNGSLFDPVPGAGNVDTDPDADDDGDRTDTESGDVQGDGGYVDPNAVGHTIRTQPHDGGLPQIITVEGDFDDDPETKEVLSFFDLDGDGQYAAQMARDGETISFAAPEILSGEKLQGALSFIDNIARAKAEATGDIKIEAVANSGDPAVMTLTINGEEYALDHKLETPLDNPYLSQSLETQ